MSVLPLPVVVTCECDARKDEALQVASRLALPMVETAASTPLQLCLTAEAWVLKQAGCLPIIVSFNPLSWRQSVSARDHLFRACRPSAGRRIVDLTAGLARDAAILASFGAQLCLVERDPIMQVLLADGIQRAETSRELAVGQVVLRCTDALSYLNALDASDAPDVIYYDPMHPARVKSAQVNHALQCLQTWLPPEADPLSILTVAKMHALDRVVLKWPARAPQVGHPNHQLVGKTIRYDVYLPIYEAAGADPER